MQTLVLLTDCLWWSLTKHLQLILAFYVSLCPLWRQYDSPENTIKETREGTKFKDCKPFAQRKFPPARQKTPKLGFLNFRMWNSGKKYQFSRTHKKQSRTGQGRPFNRTLVFVCVFSLMWCSKCARVCDCSSCVTAVHVWLQFMCDRSRIHLRSLFLRRHTR